MATAPTSQSLVETAELFKSNYHLPPSDDHYSASVYAAALIHSQYPNVPKRDIQSLTTSTLGPAALQDNGLQIDGLNTRLDSAAFESTLLSTKHHAPSTGSVEAKQQLSATIPTNTSMTDSDLVPTPHHFPVAQPKYRLTRVIKAHDNWVTSVDVDVGNNLFATASNDQTIKVWDLAKGSQLYTFTGHLLPVNAVRFSPNHPRLFSCSSDREVKMWDLETNQFLSNFHGHKFPVTTIEVHPTLDLVLSASSDKTIRVWDMRTRTAVRVLEGHREAITTMVGLPTDPQIVSGSFDASIRLWDIGTGKTYSTHTYHSKSIRKLAVHPSQYTLLSASSDSIKQWRLPVISSIPHSGQDQWDNHTQKQIYLDNPQLASRTTNPITGNTLPLKPLQEPMLANQLTLMGAYRGGLVSMIAANAKAAASAQLPQKGNTPQNQGRPLVHGLALNDANVVLAARSDGVVDCYDYSSGECYDSILTPAIQGSLEGEAAICDIAFDATGTAFLTACADKTVKMFVQQQ